MKVSLRAMSWATRFFWIIALAVTITCIYSVTQIQLGFAEPAINLTEETMTITLPITLGNNGYYSIVDLNITTSISDVQDNEISEATTYIPQIPPQENSTILHNITIPLQEIIINTDYLFNDSNFTLHGLAQLEYANLVPFSLETNTTIPWGAPLYNLTVGDPTYSVYNVSHLVVRVPINFDNHSLYFSVTGDLRIEFLNSDHQVIGEAVMFMDVPSGTSYYGQFEAVINTMSIIGIEEAHLYLETSMFNYGPIVIGFG
jgi:hypothetical protein